MNNKKNSAAVTNAISVVKKLFTGSFVILLVGVCAFISLLVLMSLV